MWRPGKKLEGTCKDSLVKLTAKTTRTRVVDSSLLQEGLGRQIGIQRINNRPEKAGGEGLNAKTHMTGRFTHLRCPPQRLVCQQAGLRTYEQAC